jgi:hypothetical protein
MTSEEVSRRQVVRNEITRQGMEAVGKIAKRHST